MQKAAPPEPSVITSSNHPPQRDPTAGTRLRWIAIVSVCLAFASCYLREFVFPRIPILSWGDQMLYATDGARMIAGQAPYRDYFLMLTPGTDLVYAALFRWLGLFLWIPNMTMVCLATLAILLLTMAAAKVLRGWSLVLPILFGVGLVLYGGLDATHHWFSTVFITAAMLVLLQGVQLWRIALAGALCGLAASFTQTKGGLVLAGFVIYLTWLSMQEKKQPGQAWRRVITLCGASMASFLVVNGHYIYTLGIREWIKWVILFSLRYYPTTPGQNWRSSWGDLQHYPGLGKWILGPFLYLIVPLSCIAFVGTMCRRRTIEKDEPWNQLLLIAITSLAMLFAVAPAPSVMRLSTVSLPATILLAWLLNRAGAFGKMAGAALAAISLCIALYLPFHTQRSQWHYLSLPAGRTAILDAARYDLYRWMAGHTHPGQMYFGISPLSLPLRLQTPAPIQSPGPWEYYRPEHIAASIDALEKNHIPLLLLRPYDNLAGTRGYQPDHLRSYEAYLNQHYRPIKVFATGDVAWQRKDIAEPASK